MLTCPSPAATLLGVLAVITAAPRVLGHPTGYFYAVDAPLTPHITTFRVSAAPYYFRLLDLVTDAPVAAWTAGVKYKLSLVAPTPSIPIGGFITAAFVGAW